MMQAIRKEVREFMHAAETLLGPVVGAAVFAILDERLSTSLELREVLYGVFVIAIFLFFRRGVVDVVLRQGRRIGRRRTRETGPPRPAPSEP